MPRLSRELRLAVYACALAVAALWSVGAQAQTRMKDTTQIGAIGDDVLAGYGLVVGLNGRGDGLVDRPFTHESLIGMLQRLGVNARDADLDADADAAVMVTADLPPFSRRGSRIDTPVSSLGTADSLLGGTPLVTPLPGADREVYALARGPVNVNGFTADGAAEEITKRVPTAGRIPNGAIIEREIAFQLGSLSTVPLQLRNPDLTTARRVASAINQFVGQPAARSLDPARVRVDVPENYAGDTVGLLTGVEQLPISPDQVTKAVINESSGVIVMAANVRISNVATAQGNLTIRVTETLQVAQPGPFAQQGQTEVVPRTDVEVDENNANRMAVLPEGVTLQQLVDGQNALGVGPRDMIAILHPIKAAGALQAEIEVL